VTDLDDLLEGPEPDYESDPTPPGDVATVNAWVRRLNRIDAEQDADEALAAEQIEKVGRWLEDRSLAREAQRTWLARSLADYHRAVLRDAPKQTTVSLPDGDLTSRRGTTYEVADEAALLAWAILNGASDLVAVPDPPPIRLDKRGLRSLPTTLPKTPDEGDHGLAVTATGEAVPGVTVTATRTFTVKPREGMRA
jgi:hypothetical protein